MLQQLLGFRGEKNCQSFTLTRCLLRHRFWYTSGASSVSQCGSIAVTPCISYQPSSFCWQRKKSTSCGRVRASTDDMWMRSFRGEPVSPAAPAAAAAAASAAGPDIAHSQHRGVTVVCCTALCCIFPPIAALHCIVLQFPPDCSNPLYSSHILMWHHVQTWSQVGFSTVLYGCSIQSPCCIVEQLQHFTFMHKEMCRLQPSEFQALPTVSQEGQAFPIVCQDDQALRIV